jgi:hypothetical protein
MEGICPGCGGAWTQHGAYCAPKEKTNMKPRVYVAGPMTGYENFNYPAFHEAAKLLRYHGYEVVSPAELNDQSVDWVSAMKTDIAALVHCGIVFVLPGWEKSKGTNIELLLATLLGIEIRNIDGTALRFDVARCIYHLLTMLKVAA